MSVWHDTLNELGQLSKRHSRVVVAFSGGKDSLAVLHLCRKVFREVSGFFMYLIPGLECVEAQLDAARRRWGIDIAMYPHWLLFKLLKRGVYCDDSWRKDDLPEFSLHDIYTIAMAGAGATLCVTGAKDADSLWRRRFFTSTAHWNGMLYPIRKWNKFDVLSYLKANNIPVPDGSKGTATGIDLSTPSLLWLHDRHPEDFRRLLEWFPFAEAAVWRRRFYGVV